MNINIERKYLLMVLLLAGIVLSVAPFSSLRPPTVVYEPPEHAYARSQVTVQALYRGEFVTLEWYPYQSVYGKEIKQYTVSYLLVLPSFRKADADTEVIAQLYNPEGTWVNKDFNVMIVEMTKMSWSEIVITTMTWDGQRTFTFPPVYFNEEPSVGYVCFGVPIIS